VQYQQLEGQHLKDVNDISPYLSSIFLFDPEGKLEDDRKKLQNNLSHATHIQ